MSRRWSQQPPLPWTPRTAPGPRAIRNQSAQARQAETHPSPFGRRRLVPPIPPFQPKQTVPVPAPICTFFDGASPMRLPVLLRRAPAGHAGPADRSNRNCSSRQLRCSSSPAPGWTPTSGCLRRVIWTSASSTSPTLSVFVSATGASNRPSSRTCSNPAGLPYPLIV